MRLLTRCASQLLFAQHAPPLTPPKHVHINHIALITRQFAVVGRKSKNVAAKKNKQDALRTKLFQRLGVKILLTAKKGGVDPDQNVELARALKEAHSVSLPKENIERALKKAADTGSSSDDEYKPGNSNRNNR